MPLLLSAYQRFVPFFQKGILAYVHHRLKKGKEDPERLNERFGKASILRPKGPIIWFHGASVGEVVSLLPLLRCVRTQFPHITPLVTTGTVTAARVVDQLLPEGCLHQYSPLDVPSWINRFLTYWQPQVAIFVESELWPNLILACQNRKIPLYLVNACLSEKSYRSWKRFPSVIRHLLSCFEAFLAQSETMAERFKNLGAPLSKIHICGNLKFAADPLPYDSVEFSRMQLLTQGRPLWVAASTHSGEESLIGDAHNLVKQALPDILTIIIPRHPHRGEKIVKDLRAKGLKVTRRSCQEAITSSTDIYIADTIGELGLFYRLTDVSFMGGTFVSIGGHNPIEAALLDCALIWGPYTHKQTEICKILKPAASTVATKEELATTIKLLLTEEMARKSRIDIARSLLKKQTHVLDMIIQILKRNLKLKNNGISRINY